MLRLAQPRDFTAVFEIYMDPSVIPFLTFEPMQAGEFLPHFEDLLKSGCFHVWDELGKVRGFCRINRHPGRAAHGAYFGTFAVHPRDQGKGVARKILDTVISKLKEQGMTRIELMVEEDNTRAIAFYRRFGFEIEGVMRNAYKRAHEKHYVNELLMGMLFES
ncbi:MAG: GNAT family N-acetyltransferase [Rhodanobacteraceae bacterium]|nr:GNAT family N-acetyltransferase [Rhodanobacteraceae bacterium]